MALTDYKITDANYTNKDIASLNARPQMTAAELQARFDALVKEVVATKFNDLIDALAANSGANLIGKTVADMAGTNVGELIAELKTLKAPLANPGFTGSPTAPTQLAADDSAKLATTEFVHEVVNEAVFDSGSADMAKATYDTGNKGEDVFDYADAAGKQHLYTGSLTVAGWTLSGGVYSQTLQISGLAATGAVYIAGASNADRTAYINAEIYMEDVTAADTAVFRATRLPTAAIGVKIVGVKI